MSAAVVDTSVVIKWFVAAGEPHVEQAKALLTGHRLGDIRLHVPTLALYEIGNALLQCGRTLPPTEQMRCLTDVFALELTIHELTDQRANTALQLAATYAVTFYDACFVALAGELDVPLITADERLLRQCGTLPFVQSLAASAHH